MSYQVLARKWRPKSFATLVGQEHVVRALTHALEQKRLHHAYLFTGTRGVGKTTIARIMAKALNCETGITPSPCGVCSACQEIDSGRFVDLIEVDAATNTKVDQMRELLDNAVYAPTRGRFKVFVIDEVHMLSNNAFNAMLKTLEEPPEHIKFILATTDPQKIPVTVLSRCLQFNLKQMSQHSIVEHLTRLLGEEHISFEPPALRHLAKAAAGSMRDALSLLDQAIAHGSGMVKEEDVKAMLGTVGDDYLFGLLDALQMGDANAMFSVADNMEVRSLSFDSALLELATLIHRIALLQIAPAAISDATEREKLTSYAAAMDAEFLQLSYQIAIHGREELALAPDEYTGFTMALVRLLAFSPQSATQSGFRALPPPVPPARCVVEAPAIAVASLVVVPDLPSTTESPDHTSATPLASVVPPPPSTPVQGGDVPVSKIHPEDWLGVVACLPLAGMAKQLAHHTELAAMDEAQISLRLPPSHKHLLGRAQQDKLQSELEIYFRRSLKLSVTLAEVNTATLAVLNQNERRQRQEDAVAAIEGDPFVQQMVDMFDATIDDATIKPI